jgi:hypothetical protein
MDPGVVSACEDCVGRTSGDCLANTAFVFLITITFVEEAQDAHSTELGM